MENIEKEGVIIDVCPFCNGMFLDDGEIEKLVQIARKNMASKKTAEKSGKKTSKSKKHSSEESSKKASKKSSRSRR